MLRPLRCSRSAFTGSLSLSVLLIACQGLDLTTCPAADDSVYFGYSSLGSGEESVLFDEFCKVVSVQGDELKLTCSSDDPNQTLKLQASPAPDLSAFTPGLVMHVEFNGQYYEHSESSLRITTEGGDLLFHGTSSAGGFNESDFAPLHFIDAAGCRPKHRTCGFTTARASWTVLDGDQEARVVGGSFARIGSYSLWVGRAEIRVRGDGGDCDDYVPESFTMAVLYTP